MVTSLMVPAIVVISSLSVSQVSASPGPLDYENIVRGGATAYNTQNSADSAPPWKWYGPDKPQQCPPIMAANRYGTGGVVAAGFVCTCRNGRWNNYQNHHPYLDALLDAAFQWMVPGAENVLWFGEDKVDENVYNDAAQCSELITALRGRGYRVDNTIDKKENWITSSLLAPYDILVIPQMELGSTKDGGDPSLIKSDVDAIVAFVDNGGGLLIMEGNDTFYNFYRVQNRILQAFNMGIYFQSDALYDDSYKYANNWEIYADINTTTSIGTAYQENTGDNMIGLYMTVSLAVRENYELTLSVTPEYQMALPGGRFTCDVEVAAAGWITPDNVTLGIENVWPAWLDTYTFDNVVLNPPKKTTLHVEIPSDAALGDIDEITVTATSGAKPTLTVEAKTVAIASMRIGPPSQDTYVTQYADEKVRPLGSYIWIQVGSGPDNNKRAYLQFDLRAIPSGLIPPDDLPIDDLHVRLFAHCSRLAYDGTPGKNVQCCEVENNAWLENEMKWGEKEPVIGAVLDNTKVTGDGYWYSWDVTSFVLERRGVDNIVSFCLKAETDNLGYPDNFVYYSFDSSNIALKENWKHPYLVIGYDVSTWISPDYDGLPGGTLTSTVSVQNMGSENDNYDLTVENIWEATLSASRFENVPPMGTKTATLTIKIPVTANDGDTDNVRVTAVSERSAENDVGSCLARAKDNIVSAWEDSTTRAQLHLENSTWGMVNATGLERASYTIYVGRFEAGPENNSERAWLKFDLRAIPSLDGVVRVNLSLNCRQAAPFPTGSSFVKCYGVDNDNWLENEINWRNKPSIGSLLDERSVTEQDRRYTWDITDFVRSQFENDNIASFCLVDLGENINPEHSANFNSKEDENMDLRPYLEILTAKPTREVRVSIKPVFQGGKVGDNLQYTVTVKNTGTAADNYDLKVENTAPWPRTLENNWLLVPQGENRTTTLSVNIPSGEICTIDNITVTAISRGNNTVYDNARCFAHRGAVDFKLENLYKISIGYYIGATWSGMSLLLRDGAENLVVKFYDWSNSPQGESSIWDNAWPWQLIKLAFVPHPLGTRVEKVRVVLTGAGGGEIRTVASYTVTKSILSARYSKCKRDYSFAPPGEKPFYSAEYGAIKKAYNFAPS